MPDVTFALVYDDGAGDPPIDVATLTVDRSQLDELKVYLAMNSAAKRTLRHAVEHGALMPETTVTNAGLLDRPLTLQLIGQLLLGISEFDIPLAGWGDRRPATGTVVQKETGARYKVVHVSPGVADGGSGWLVIEHLTYGGWHTAYWDPTGPDLVDDDDYELFPI